MENKKVEENLLEWLEIIRLGKGIEVKDIDDGNIEKRLKEILEEYPLNIYVNLGNGEEEKMINLTEINRNKTKMYMKRSEIKKITGLNGEQLSNWIYRLGIDKMRNKQINDSYISIEILPILFQMIRSELKSMGLEYKVVHYKGGKTKKKEYKAYPPSPYLLKKWGLKL